MTARLASDRRRGWLVPLLLGLGFGLVGTAWAVANPPMASPDEPANLVKAYATGRGDLLGEARGVSPDNTQDNPLAQAWFERANRSFAMPPEVQPRNFPCFAFFPNRSAACLLQQTPEPPKDLVATQLGTYQPFLYAPAGLAMQGSSSYVEAERRGRLVNVALLAVFIAAGTRLLWDPHDRRSGLAVAGLALGVTPMVVFLSASVTTNGIEAAAAVCTWAALLRLTRRADPPAWAWLGLAAGGSTMALSRMLDPAYLIVMVVVVLVARGMLKATPAAARTAVGTVRQWMREGTGERGSRWPLVAIGIVVVSALASMVWSLTVTAHPDVDLTASREALGPSLTDLPNQVRQAIGIFGWNDLPMPLVFYALWLAVAGLLILLALRAGTTAERVALAGLGLAVVAADVGIAVAIQAPIGFGMQARYVLPLVVGVPMVAAEVLAGHTEPVGLRRWLPPVTLVTAAVLHFAAFAVNAHRYAVGANGSWALPWLGPWSPPGGLLLWIAVAAAGVGCLVAAGWAAAPSSGASGSTLSMAGGRRSAG